MLSTQVSIESFLLPVVGVVNAHSVLSFLCKPKCGLTKFLHNNGYRTLIFTHLGTPGTGGICNAEWASHLRGVISMTVQQSDDYAAIRQQKEQDRLDALRRVRHNQNRWRLHVR